MITKPISPRQKTHHKISGSRLFMDASQPPHGSFRQFACD
jgi:hypothetical protein